MPTVKNHEDDDTATVFDLVAANYVGENTLPDIETFFRFSPALNSITSQTFQSDMAGTHEVNITIADLYDARRFASLYITVDSTYNDTRVTEPTALGESLATIWANHIA